MLRADPSSPATICSEGSHVPEGALQTRTRHWLQLAPACPPFLLLFSLALSPACMPSVLLALSPSMECELHEGCRCFGRCCLPSSGAMQGHGRCSAGCFCPLPTMLISASHCVLTSAIFLWLTGLVHNFWEIALKGINSLFEDTRHLESRE